MAAKINWHIYGTNYVIDVKTFFMFFFILVTFFTFFNVFLFSERFLFKKRWKGSELQAD